MGVKGARVGVDAGGKPYVAGGRDGIYFRERVEFPATQAKKSGLPWWIVLAIAAAIVVAALR